MRQYEDINMGEEDCFTRVCGHKAQTGVRMIAEALTEMEICRDRTQLEKEALQNARKSLLAVNLMLNVISLTDARRQSFDA
jgi:coenzyme F420-reducing hydrogenase delta subunit